MTKIASLQRPTMSTKESVWDYPETPRVEAVTETLNVTFNGIAIARSKRAKRVLQQGIPPTYYFPSEDVDLTFFRKTPHRSYCDEKGFAEYWTITIGERSARNAAWTYTNALETTVPTGYIAFYAHLMDACFVGAEPATSPPWTWLGGWVTNKIESPFLTQEAGKQKYLAKTQNSSCS